jgi:starch synthase (maltosyl-transferring)
LIARVNRIRRENPALQEMERLDFHYIENEKLLVYSKTTEDFGNVILVVVNLDPDHAQSGWVGLVLETLGVTGASFEVHDLLTGARYNWHGSWNYVELRPGELPAHLFRVTPA